MNLYLLQRTDKVHASAVVVAKSAALARAIAPGGWEQFLTVSYVGKAGYHLRAGQVICGMGR